MPESADVDAALKKGELKFALDGEKLHGGWVLVRTGPAAARGSPRGSSSSTATSTSSNARHRRGGAALGRLEPAPRRDRARRGRQHGEGGRRRPARAAAQDARRTRSSSRRKKTREEVRLALEPPAARTAARNGVTRRRSRDGGPAKRRKRRRADTRLEAAAASTADDPRGASASRIRTRSTGPTRATRSSTSLRFYVEAFDRLRPYVEDRLLSLERCPDGMKGQCFFQKEKPPGCRGHAHAADPAREGSRRTTSSAAGSRRSSRWRTWAASRSTSGARGARLRASPTGSASTSTRTSGKFADAVSRGAEGQGGARRARPRLVPEDLGRQGTARLRADPRRARTADEVLEFAERLGTHLAAAYPKELTMESRIAGRKGRVYLDPFRNGFAQTVVAPYSVRPGPARPSPRRSTGRRSSPRSTRTRSPWETSSAACGRATPGRTSSRGASRSRRRCGRCATSRADEDRPRRLPAARGGGTVAALSTLRIVLVKPSKYAADGAVERFRRGFMPNSTLPHLASLTPPRSVDAPSRCTTVDEYVETDLDYLRLLEPTPARARCSPSSACRATSSTAPSTSPPTRARTASQHVVIGGPHPMTCDTTDAAGPRRELRARRGRAGLDAHPRATPRAASCSRSTARDAALAGARSTRRSLVPPSRASLRRYAVPDARRLSGARLPVLAATSAR